MVTDGGQDQGFTNNTAMKTSEMALPEWNDSAVKYIKKEFHGSDDKNTRSSPDSQQKAFLYPLLNKSKRKQFK